MTTELLGSDLHATEEPFAYHFIVDAELAQVGGGSALVDY